MSDDKSPTTTNPDGSRKHPGWQGMEAKWNGLPADACPYEPGPQRTAWVVGWYISERKTPDVKS